MFRVVPIVTQEIEGDLMMKSLPPFRNSLGNRRTLRYTVACIVACAGSLQLASRADAHIDFAVDCSDGLPCELIPVLNPNQVLRALEIPDIFPDNPCLTCPPFIEFFDIPELNPGDVQPPPSFEARVRMFGGDPDPQPNITDNPNIPNLLLIFDGPNDIAGPMEFASFSIPLPSGTTQLSFQAQAFDGSGNVVSNSGIIAIPEPTSAALIAVGAALVGLRMRRRTNRSSRSENNGDFRGR